MQTDDKTTVLVRRIVYRDAADEQLVIAALIGDLKAFDELITRYRAAVIATAAPFVNSRAAAEDIAQEIFLLAFHALPQLEDPARFGGWLRVVTRRQAQRLAGREKRCNDTLPLLEEILIAERYPEQSDPVTMLARREEQEILWAALEMLSPEQREILLLRAVEEWSLERIAVYLGLSEGAARVRLFRAREVMRRLWSALNDDSNDDQNNGTIVAKGKKNVERRTKERGETPQTTAARDVQTGGTRQPVGGAGGRSGGIDRAIQCDSSASVHARNPDRRSVPAAPGGRLD